LTVGLLLNRVYLMIWSREAVDVAAATLEEIRSAVTIFDSDE